MPDRPGEVVGEGQPVGQALGVQGPDQGYALTLAHRLVPELKLAEGEHVEDVVAAGVSVALRRAALYGRAPVVHDLRVAFGAFGYLDDAPEQLIEHRRPLTAGLGHHHHYVESRHLATSVPETTLRMTPEAVRAKVATDWRTLLGSS